MAFSSKLFAAALLMMPSRAVLADEPAASAAPVPAPDYGSQAIMQSFNEQLQETIGFRAQLLAAQDRIRQLEAQLSQAKAAAATAPDPAGK